MWSGTISFLFHFHFHLSLLLHILPAAVIKADVDEESKASRVEDIEDALRDEETLKHLTVVPENIFWIDCTLLSVDTVTQSSSHVDSYHMEKLHAALAKCAYAACRVPNRCKGEADGEDYLDEVANGV